MTHYNIDYSDLEDAEKQAKAIADIIDYLGSPSKFNELTTMFREEADGNMHQRWFEIACSFAGVQGYPVVAWFHHCFPNRPWLESRSADQMDLEVAREVRKQHEEGNQS